MSWTNATKPTMTVEYLATQALDFLMTESGDFLITNQSHFWGQVGKTISNWVSNLKPSSIWTNINK